MSRNMTATVSGAKKGRLVALAMVAFLLVAGIYFLVAPTRESKQLEQSLIDQFGWANEYTPLLDGSVAAPRLAAFIRVRQAVQPACLGFQGFLDDLIALEEIEHDPDMAATEKASKGIETFKSMFTMSSKMLALVETRNKALLAEGMGLGEYFHIYMAAYSEQLANESNLQYADMEEAHISQRARDEFSQILGNHLHALEGGDHDASGGRLIAELQKQIDDLNNGSHPPPWASGLPDSTRKSLEESKKQLADLYCSGVVKIELQQKNRGFNFDG